MAQKNAKSDNKNNLAKSSAPNIAHIPNKLFPFLQEWAIAGTAILLANAVLHLPFLDIPLERDESIYYYLGKCALDGDRPYFDFYELKPPGLFYAYALLVALFGYSAVGVHVAVMAVSFLNTMFTWFLARHIAGKRAAIIAASAFMLLSMHPAASGPHLMSEHVALLFGLPGLWLSLGYPEDSTRWKLVLGGFLLSLAVMVKQTAGVMGLSVLVYWLAYWLTQRQKWTAQKHGMALSGWLVGGLVPLALSYIVILVSGTTKEASFWLFDYAKLYATNIKSEEASRYFEFSWENISEGYMGYFLVAVAGLAGVWFTRLSLAKKIFLTFWTLSAAATILPGNRFYGHYWLLAFPAIAIAGSVFFLAISHSLLKKEQMPVWLTALGVLWGMHHFGVNPRFYTAPSFDQLEQKYSSGNPFAGFKTLSENLKKRLKPTDRVAVFGADVQPLIYLGKKSPIRHIYMPFIAKGNYPEAKIWQRETMEALKAQQPEYVIFSAFPYAWMLTEGADQRFMQNIWTFLKNNYESDVFVETGTLQQKKYNTNVKTGEPVEGQFYLRVFKRRGL